MVRQVAYATQSRRDRKARHLAAAEHLAALPDPSDDLAVVIARHLLDAIDAAPHEDRGSPALAARACTYLERAAARARRVGAPGEAQRLLEIALESRKATTTAQGCTCSQPRSRRTQGTVPRRAPTRRPL